MTDRRRFAGLVLGVALVVAGCTGATTTSPVASAPASAGSDQAAAEQYCTDQGGMLVDRVATWNTNADQSQWLQLAGRQRFCEFEMGAGDETTRISVDLVTLYSEEPTLAGVAYLSKVKPTLPPQPSANPATYNCQEGLGGSASFGNGAAGGGWVDTSQPVFVVMDMCAFEDMSAIDAFGILYYADGTVRGADLATKMRYKPGPGNRLPAIFGN
ncbi:MAG TPA: hypothetical protein VIZ22_08685 [Candidatus Limnocylindrales bacterium]